MKITIDTAHDSKEDIRRAVSVLSKYIEGDNSGAQNMFSGSSVNSTAIPEESSKNSTSGFVDMFGSSESYSENNNAISSSETNSAENTLPQNNNNNNNESCSPMNIFGENKMTDDENNIENSAAKVSDIFGSSISNNDNKIMSNIPQNQKRIGNFKGTPVINEINDLHQLQNEEITEDQKNAAKNIISYD